MMLFQRIWYWINLESLGWYVSLFSSLVYLIMYWYCKEYFWLGHSKELWGLKPQKWKGYYQEKCLCLTHLFHLGGGEGKSFQYLQGNSREGDFRDIQVQDAISCVCSSILPLHQKIVFSNRKYTYQMIYSHFSNWK